MMRRARWMAFLLVTVLAVAAGTPGLAVRRSKPNVRPAVQEGKALVYFIRAPSWGRGVDTRLYIYSDDAFLGVLVKSSYAVAQLDPGEHFLWNSASARDRATTDLTSTRQVTLEAGHRYFIVMNYRVPPHVFFALVEPEDGEALLKEVRSHVEPEDQDIAEATRNLDERLSWLHHVDDVQHEPPDVIRRMPEAHRLEALCAVRTIYIQPISISETGNMRRANDAESFRRSLQKRLGRQGFEAVEAVEGADATVDGVVDKRRVEWRRGYKYVRSASVSLKNLQGQEMWSTKVDTEQSNVTTNAFNAWSQLAKRVVLQLKQECRP